MNKDTFSSLEEFGKAYKTDNIHNEDYATIDFTGSYSKNVSVENIISNNLFLFKFEDTYVHEYLKAFNYYKTHNVRQKYSTLQSQLKTTCENLLVQSVNPIESMLYASKTIDSYLSDLKLSDTIADVVKTLYVRLGPKVYTETLFHIMKYWGKWEPQIKISIMASSKSMEYELIEYILNNFFDNYFYKVEAFKCILDSKIEHFIPNILEIVYKLNPNDEIDRRIGNEFDRKFLRNFHEYEINKYIEMLPIPKNPYLLRKLEPILDINIQDSFVDKMKNAKTEQDKKKVVNEAVIALKKSNANKNDIIFALSMSGIDHAGYQLLNILNDKEFKSDKWEPINLMDCIICFAFLKYSNAAGKINELSKNKKLKGVAFIALCILGELDVEVLITNYFRESEKQVINSYKKGFARMRRDTHFAKQVRDELVETFTKVLTTKNHNLIGTSIRNILTLIKIDITFYPFSLFTVIQELFGYKDQNHPEVKIQDQLYLLEIVHLVINDRNRHRYQDFLFYVEKTNVNIKEAVKQKANTILNDKFPIENIGTT